MTKVDLISMLEPFEDNTDILVDAPTDEIEITGYAYRWNSGDRADGARIVLEVKR